MIKRILKGLFILLGVLVAAFFILKWSFSEEVPKGETGSKATALATQMLEALNAPALEKTDSILWTFRGVNHYNYNLINRTVVVRWGDNTVQLDPRNPSSSIAFKNDISLQEKDREDAIDYALNNFNNDSFWLLAPYKIMDAGTEREWISKNELLVRYTSGGSTPGDVYVWQLDDNHIPTSFKMWVQIIPLDGLKAEFNNWTNTTSGFKLPESRTMYGIEIPVSDVVVY